MSLIRKQAADDRGAPSFLTAASCRGSEPLGPKITSHHFLPFEMNAYVLGSLTAGYDSVYIDMRSCCEAAVCCCSARRLAYDCWLALFQNSL